MSTLSAKLDCDLFDEEISKIQQMMVQNSSSIPLEPASAGLNINHSLNIQNNMFQM